MTTRHQDSCENVSLVWLGFVYLGQLGVIIDQWISHRFGPFQFQHNFLG